jgi:hypothetical protein
MFQFVELKCISSKFPRKRPLKKPLALMQLPLINITQPHLLKRLGIIVGSLFALEFHEINLYVCAAHRAAKGLKPRQ